ncbi:MAG: acetylxylan esterase [Parasphingorhabdus sp.]|nr:acetylxylan esterase [Parasphingorhabdus sp.]
MARIGLSIFIALLVGGIAVSAPLLLDRVGSKPQQWQPLPLHVGGRVQALKADGIVRYRHQWPGVYFEAQFVGSRAVARFGGSAHRYRLYVDGVPFADISKPGKSDFAIDGLPAGQHALRLETVSENNAPGDFIGFFAPSSSTPLDSKPTPPPKRSRQIEFIGNSFMNGYGITHQGKQLKCTAEEVWATTDTGQAFPVLTAKHFDADYQIIAKSSNGIVRNYDGVRPGVTMATLYPYTLVAQTIRYDDPAWRPAVIIIGLFGAEFARPLKPQEPWGSFDALFADYVTGSIRMVKDIHKRHPHAAIMFMIPEPAMIRDPAGAKQLTEARTALADAASAEKITDFAFWFPKIALQNTGCNGHGNIADNRALADHLIKLLEAREGIWAGG